MCGRIGLPQLTSKQFAAWQRGEFDWDEFYREEGSEPLEPSWNIKPTQLVTVLCARQKTLVSANARWWLVPKWFEGTPKEWKATTFNAKIETADSLPSFRGASRCAIPASGYYEWTGEKGDKQPWWITTNSNAPAMFFAGIHTRLKDGSRTCAILTRPALDQIEHIHHRTPVILGDGELAAWLTGSISTADAKADLGTAWDGRLKFHRVQKFGITDDGPELIEPFEDQ
ncbi:SOS response-associated peptidase [Rhodobacteraceae bacterium G21628-S1]|nr:SOS response-associated peptidase [Rhodobacteraceae bacterium G21628-S1]